MLTHTDVIRYLRELGRELSRNAEQMTDNAHPMATHFESRAEQDNVHIETVCALLSIREETQHAEFENAQSGPRYSDREDFHSDL